MNELLHKALNLAWIPFLTAFIGWITNWLAIQMLFRPRQPIRILGLRIQGLVPRCQLDVAERVAEVAEREFISQHLIHEQMHLLDVHGYVDHFVRRIVRERFGVKLRSVPLIGNFINEPTMNLLERYALEAVREEIEPMRHRLASDVEARLQVRDIVRERIVRFEMEEIETLVRQVATRELRLIEWVGAVLGFAVGLGQVIILLLI